MPVELSWLSLERHTGEVIFSATFDETYRDQVYFGFGVAVIGPCVLKENYNIVKEYEKGVEIWGIIPRRKAHHA